MRNKVVSTSHRSVWFSLLFLLFFSITEANEEWLQDYSEENIYDASSSIHPDELVSEYLIDHEFLLLI